MNICEPMPAVESQAPSSKLERERAAQIGQADRRQAAVEIGEKRAEQHRDDGEQRPRPDAAARYRAAIVVTFGHRRYRILVTTDMPGSRRSSSGWFLSSCDTDRDALHDLGEIAGRVVRRQQRELRAARRRDALDAAVQGLLRETVDRDFDRLARLDMGELGFLVIRDHIDVRQRHDIDEVGADIDVIAGLHLTLAGDAVERRDDPGVAELQLCRRERRLGGFDIGGALLLGSLQDFELMALRGDHRAARLHVRLRLGITRGRLLEPLPCAGIGLRQRLLTLLLLLRLDLHALRADTRCASACAIVAYCSSTWLARLSSVACAPTTPASA